MYFHQIMRITQKHTKAAENLMSGEMTIEKSLVEAGYSEETAKRGRAAISSPILKAMGRNAKKFMELGRMSVEQQELIVRGGLAFNVLRREDKGVNSMKALGSDRRVNLFTPEIQVGIQIINAPKEMSAAIVKEEE